jgi:hypothetical protein
MIEPSSPVFSRHQRRAGTELSEALERILGAANSEVDDRRHAVEGSVRQLWTAIGRVDQRASEAGIEERPTMPLEIGLVFVEGSVLVFELHGDDRPRRRAGEI